MTFRGPQSSGSRSLKLAIIRMRAKRNDAQFAVIRWDRDAFNGAETGLSSQKQSAGDNE
jgi:hypothetical protein